MLFFNSQYVCDIYTVFLQFSIALPDIHEQKTECAINGLSKNAVEVKVMDCAQGFRGKLL